MTNYSLDGSVRESFLRLCDKAGTPLSLKLSLAVRREDWDAVVNCKVPISLYRCVKTLSWDLQLAAYLKKYPGFDLGRDLEKQAEDSFWESERQCFQTNERLSPLFFDLNHFGGRIGGLIKGWRAEIRKVLGRAPRISSLRPKFGPGATFLNKGDDITVAHKLSESYTLTRLARAVLQSWDRTAWASHAACGLSAALLIFTPQGSEIVDSSGTCYHQYYYGENYAPRDTEFVRGNRFTTVPKDATKLRGICIEPSINVFYQLGVGAYISARLRKTYGWIKETAQDYHQILARIASLTGACATIDLSSASDTVCSNLVKLLFPPDWWRLVDDLRSRHTLINGRWVKLEKFSSMGNGFTFEVETLIFWTLSKALQAVEPPTEDPYTPGVTTSVFGDDIICPSSHAPSLVSALRFFGFKTNESKTFLSGSFRESCGGDFYAGHDVRPHFVKEVPNEPHQLVALANGIRRFGERRRLLGDDTRSHLPAWFRVLDAIPKQIRDCRGPEDLGDLVVQDDEAIWSKATSIRERSSIRYLRVWRPVPNRVISWGHFRPGVVMACALYGVPSGTPNLSATEPDRCEAYRRSGVIPRVNGSYVSGYRFGRVAYS